MESFIEVSVLMCTYNGASYLRKQLDSILNQTYPISKIIIVDDCSRDNTIEIIKEYQRENHNIDLILNTENLGSNRSFHKVISLAETELFALCDQDDIWKKNKIEEQIKLVESSVYDNSKPLVVFHDLELMDNDEEIIAKSFWDIHKFNAAEFNFEDLFLFNIVTGCTCLLNQSMKREILKSDMKQIIMHDYLIALIGYGFGKVMYSNQQLMLYRSHSNSVTIKERITFSDRIFSFLDRVKSKEYLMPNILQIEECLNLYGESFTNDKLKLMLSFTGLKHKGILFRMAYKWLKVS